MKSGRTAEVVEGITACRTGQPNLTQLPPLLRPPITSLSDPIVIILGRSGGANWKEGRRNHEPCGRCGWSSGRATEGGEERAGSRPGWQAVQYL